MAIRTDIVAKDCTLTYTNGQVICADDLLALLDFAKNALSQGDTVASDCEQYQYIDSTDYMISAAVAVPFVYNDVNPDPSQPSILGRMVRTWPFEYAGQTNFVLVADVRPGDRNIPETPGVNIQVNGHIEIWVRDHLGAIQRLYDSRTAGTSYNVDTRITVNDTILLTKPAPTETEIWELEIRYSITPPGSTTPVTAYTFYPHPMDGVQRFSLKLYTVC
jgi:hypothetical protein